MPATVKMKLDGRFKNRLRVLLHHAAADVGVLQNKPHKMPLTIKQVYARVAKKQVSDPLLATRKAFLAARFKTFAGGLARKVGRRTSGTIESVSKSFREQTRINLFTRPFFIKSNREILRFTQNYVKHLISRKVSVKRVENLLQAVVRNPITRGDYGRNTKSTARAKGFNRLAIDTAQLFQNIRARVIRRVS